MYAKASRFRIHRGIITPAEIIADKMLRPPSTGTTHDRAIASLQELRARITLRWFSWESAGEHSYGRLQP